MRIRSVTALSLLALTVGGKPLHAGSYGTESPFVIGIGARAAAMGGAYTSLAGEPTVQYFNPAGLSLLGRSQVEVFRTELFDAGSLYHSLSYAHPLLSQGTLAFSIMRLDVGGIEKRDRSNLLLDDNLKNSQTRFLIGYGRSLYRNMEAGFNLKVDYQSFAGYSASGIGMDLGFLFHRRLERRYVHELRAGMMVMNLIEPTLKLNVEEVSDPLAMALGLSLSGGPASLGYSASLDLVRPKYSPFSARLGAEASYRDLIFFRVGWDQSATYGVGFSYGGVQLDYAYRSVDLGRNHRLSLSYSFGRSRGQRKRLAQARIEEEMNRKISAQMDRWEEKQISMAVEKGDSLFQAGQFDAAANYYEMALFWDPGHDHAYQRRGQCRFRIDLGHARQLMAEGSWAEALYYLERALHRVPRDTTALRLKDTAQQHLQEERSNGVLVENLLRKAIDLYAERKFPQAVAVLDRVLEADPDNGFAREYRRKCLLNIERLKEEYLDGAKDRFRRGDIAMAMKELEKALAYDPNDTGLLTFKAELEERAERGSQEKEKAKPERQSAEQKMPIPAKRFSPELRRRLEDEYTRGIRALEAGDFSSALGYFREVWEIEPSFHEVSSLLAKTYLYLGMKHYSDEDYQRAMEMWQRALAVDPTNDKARRYLEKAREEEKTLQGVGSG